MVKHYIEQARDTYSIDYWSEGYFDINEQGLVDVGISGNCPRVTLQAVLDEAQELGMQQPVLMRFMDILQHRVVKLSDAFIQAMEQLNYEADYTAVYPIKVNQQRQVVEQLYSAQHPSQRCGVGLEAGSKPE